VTKPKVETIARAVMAGLLDEFRTLTSNSNDGNALAWDAAELKARELERLCTQVAMTIRHNQYEAVNPGKAVPLPFE
jgi:hypothetical protein